MLKLKKELLTKKVPYSEHELEVHVVHATLDNEPLWKPADSTGWSQLHQCLWEVAEDCRHLRPTMRPTLDATVVLLTELQDPSYEHMPHWQEVG